MNDKRSIPACILALIAAVFLTVNCSNAQTKGGEDLRAKTQYPVGAMISLPFKVYF